MRTHFLDYVFTVDLVLGGVVLLGLAYLLYLERKRHRTPFNHRIMRILRALLPSPDMPISFPGAGSRGFRNRRRK